MRGSILQAIFGILLKKISKQIFIVSRLRHLVSRDVVIRYYNVCNKPVIQYGVLIYGCTSRNRLLPIYMQQKKLLRLFFFKSSRYHSSSLFEDWGLQNIYDIYTFELLTFSLFSIKQLQPTCYLNNIFKRQLKTSMATRATCGLYEVPAAKSQSVSHSLRYRGVKLLNTLVKDDVFIEYLDVSTAASKNQSFKTLAKLQTSLMLSDICFNTEVG